MRGASPCDAASCSEIQPSPIGFIPYCPFGLVRIGWYFAEARKRGLTLSWAAVYALVRRIPRGCVITYGQLARALRLRGGARTAGRAMAGCPSGRGIPWHRVVGAGGRILIREPQASLQRKLLESEVVRFIERRIAMKEHAWSVPSRKPKRKRRKRR
jgi:methylated-DNA-protein-cysteine methyltransferase-like protein